MSETLLIQFHVAVGFAVVLLGVCALLSPKGSRPHRLAGILFFLAMASIAGSAFVIGLFRPEVGNNSTGLMTLYLAATGWRTARRKDGETGPFEAGAALAAVGIAVLAFVWGWQGMNHPIGVKDKMFAPASYVIGGLMLCFAAMDVSVVVRRGLSGAKRITRHAWRMGFAAFFASAAGLIGQLLRFPEPVRPYFMGLVGLILLLAVFWIVRVRFTRWWEKAA